MSALTRIALLSSLACLLASAAIAQPVGPIPAGLPSHLAVGLAEDSGGTWMKSSGVPWDVRYQYLVKGWSDNFGWGAHDGSFALSFMQESDAARMIPALTWYQMNGEPGGGDAQFYAKAQSAAVTHDYFSDLKLLLQRAKDFGKPVIIHLEPDGFGFLQRQSNASPDAYAAVAASGVAELAGLPDTIAGFGMAFLQLRKAVGATNVIYAVHLSSWASGADPATASVTDALQPDVDLVYGFLKPLGLSANQTGATFELIATDPLDRDADDYRLVQGDGSKWWDASDAAALSTRSFNRYAEWLRLWNQTSGRRLILWQIPLGNSNQLNVANGGGARQGYKDNRAEYFFGGGAAHAQKFADSGVVALLFGRGQSDQSTYTNDLFTDGQPFLKTHVARFYAAGGVALAGGSGAAPAFSSSATAAPAAVAPGASVALSAAVTDVGGALQGGVVDIEVHDAGGALVGQSTAAAQSFAPHQTITYPFNWQAPAAGVYSIAVGVFGAGSTPRYHWNAAAGSVTVATTPTAAGDPSQYNFEGGAQGWASTGGMIASVASSAARAFLGTRSLAMNFSGTAAATRNVYVRSPAASAGKAVSFRLWIPAGSQLSSVQAYVQQGAAGGWKWTGTWQSASTLKAGAWNTLSVTVPAGAAPLWELGLQISTKAAWTGTAWLDSVAW